MCILERTSAFQNMVLFGSDTPLTKNDRYYFIEVPEFAYWLESNRWRSSTKDVKLYYQRTAVPVLKWYYQRTKVQPAGGHGRSSTKVLLPENENLACSQRSCLLLSTFVL